MNRPTDVRSAPAPATERATEGRTQQATQQAPQRMPQRMPQRVPQRATEPCLHCGHPVAVRLMGCRGGHCPNCRHPYPHGDCSD